MRNARLTTELLDRLVRTYRLSGRKMGAALADDGALRLLASRFEITHIQDIEQPQETGPLDYFFVGEALLHVPGKQLFLTKARGLLKTGGSCIICCHIQPPGSAPKGASFYELHQTVRAVFGDVSYLSIPGPGGSLVTFVARTD